MKGIGRALVLVALLTGASSAPAAVPSRLNYQGKLANAAGDPLTGTYSFRFKLFAAETGGAALFTEPVTGADAVSVVNGIYTVQIGSYTAGGIPYGVFAGPDLYLEVDVNAGATLTGAETLAPRERLNSAAWAVHALGAERLGTGAVISTHTAQGDLLIARNVAASSGMITGSYFSVGGSTLVVKDGSVGVGSADPGASAVLHVVNPVDGRPTLKLDNTYTNNPFLQFQSGGFIQDLGGGAVRVRGTGAGSYVTLEAAGAEHLRVDAAGRIGVGITASAARLHVSSAGAAAADTVLLVSSGTTASQSLLSVMGDGRVGVGTAAPAGLLGVMGDHALAHLYVANSAGKQLLRVQDVGGYARLRGADGSFLDLADIVYLNGLWSYGNLTAEARAEFGPEGMKSTFTAAPGGTAYALMTSSGVDVGAGPLVLNNGGFIRFPDGTTQATAGGAGSFVARAGDTMTGQLTISGSSLTVVHSGSAQGFVLAATSATDRSSYHLYVATTGGVAMGRAGGPAAGSRLDVAGPLFVGGTPGSLFLGGGGWPYSIGVGWNGQDSKLRFNAVGTSGGTADFRDLIVYDGKTNPLAYFTGANRDATALPTAGSDAALEVAGPVMVSADGFPGGLFLGGGGWPYSIGSGWNSNADDHALRLNAVGYQAGSTRYRDLIVYDGKTNPIAFFDGSAASAGIGTTAPSARLHVSSANAVGADTLLLVSSGAAAGQELLVVKGDGRVGVGTASPARRLDLSYAESTTGGVGLGVTNAGTAGASLNLISAPAGGRNWEIYSAGTTNGINGSLGVYDRTVGLNRMVIDTAGNVGVGTASPAEKLHVTDGRLKVGNNLWLTTGTWANPAAPDAVSEGERIVFYQGGGWKTALGMDVQNGIWTQAHVAADRPAFHVWSGLNAAAPAARFTVLGGGSVGIGTTTPGGHGSGATGPFLNVYTPGAGASDVSELYIGNAAAAGGQVAGTVGFIAGASGAEKRLGFITGETDGAQGVSPVGRLGFYTANDGAPAERMRITSAGNVGVGTAAPFPASQFPGTISNSLHVNGWILARGSGSNSWGDTAGRVGVSSSVSGGETWYFSADSSGNLDLHQGGIGDRLSISPSGNVGIGTTDPQGVLHVVPPASTDASAPRFFTPTLAEDAWNEILLGKDWAPNQGAGLRYTQSDTPANSSRLDIFIGGDGPGVVIQKGGNVGIGTTLPAGPLDVKSPATAEGTLIGRFTDSTPTPMLEVFDSNDGTAANAANAVLKVKRALSTGRSINAAGTINASGADYAEWIPWTDSRKPQPGELIVYKGTSLVVSSTRTAAFVGNDRFQPGGAVLVTFAGQVPVRVTGPTKEGDYIVPGPDGTGRAVASRRASFDEYRRAVGVSWETNLAEGVKLVLVAVGVK